MFQGNVKGVSKKFKRCFKKFSRVFQESLRVYCNFVVAWHSSQLPEQKEGLFGQGGVVRVGWVDRKIYPRIS